MIPKEAMIDARFPDSFREMSLDEIHKTFQDSYDQRWGMWDEENHSIIVIQWNKANGLLAKVVGIESVCKDDEKKLSKAMRGNSYVSEGFFDGAVCGTEFKGFSYRYVLQDQEQSAQLMVFRNGSLFYKLYYFSRSDLDGSNRESLKAVMDSMCFVNE